MPFRAGPPYRFRSDLRNAGAAKPGYEVAVKEGSAGENRRRPAEKPIENLLASASVEHGAQISKQCGACHNFQEGQGPKVGPDLYDVVGRKIASVAGL